MNANNPYRTLNDDATVNYEEEEAREWRQPSTSKSKRGNKHDGNSQYKTEDSNSGAAKTTPDEVWLVCILLSCLLQNWLMGEVQIKLNIIIILLWR